MQRFLLSVSPLFFLLSLLFLSSFHGYLVSAQGFTGTIDQDSLISVRNGSVDASGTLTLDASTGDAQAFHSQPISLFDSLGLKLVSFTSFFTFASNVTSGNGSIVFAFVPGEPTGLVSLADARKTLTIEFNTSCSTGVYDANGGYYGGRGFQGRGGGGYGGGRGGGFFGGLGGFQVAEYANSTSIATLAQGGYGPNWDNQAAPGPYFCSQQSPLNLTNPTFQYQVAIDYNATTDEVWVGSPSCGAAIARTTQFSAQNLSGIIPKSVYVGFLVSGGGVFNISQWNFTTNVNSSSVANLALSSAVSATPGTDNSGVDDGVDGGGRGGGPNGGLKKGYIIAFSVLGAAIGVAAVLLVCCLCARRKRISSARFVGKSVHQGTIPESAVMFDARKPNAPPAKVVLVDRDTTPLNSRPNSAFHGSTGTASWLQPVAPR